MNKHDYIMDLYNDIKDRIELDSDVGALYTILCKLFQMDREESIKCWKYLILKYDIKEMGRDIDFLPLIKDYPIMILENLGLNAFFQEVESISHSKLEYIYQFLFNIYDANSFIYQSLDYYIKRNRYQDEKKLIQIFLEKKKDFFKGIFDQTEFIRRVILLHLKRKNVSLEFINYLIDLIDNAKDKAVLKTLIIDYI